MAQQLRLRLQRQPRHTREEFIAGASNAQALAAVDSWPRWPGGCLVLAGPEGVGKTHLARAWAAETGAVILSREAPDLAAADGRPALLEDVDRGVPAEALFHLINLAGREGAGLLMTARIRPAAWPADLPDLRSRLNALFVAEIEAPDDDVLEGVLRKLFRERSIRPPQEVYPYLLRRMPRSIPEAQEVVRRMDESADGPISRLLARAVLEEESQNLDLFE
ncbi:DnaA/Hda family protein [Phenylobacterium sp. LjRoot225]|uniref:DnaA ATPase domain-containing protein n=1 Tax=Phenylobacterium sp. LjRoot225 TaxID=3342285 RepID=UPI003ECD1B5B